LTLATRFNEGKYSVIRLSLARWRQGLVYTILYYTVFQKKTATLFFGHNFGKWTPIFIILSLLDSAGTFLHSCYKDFHLTLDLLLHYLAKSENPIYSCFRNNPSSSHIFSNGSQLQ